MEHVFSSALLSFGASQKASTQELAAYGIQGTASALTPFSIADVDFAGMGGQS